MPGAPFQLTPGQDTSLLTELVVSIIPSPPTDWLPSRQFPLCLGNDTSLIYWFAIFQMTSYSISPAILSLCSPPSS